MAPFFVLQPWVLRYFNIDTIKFLHKFPILIAEVAATLTLRLQMIAPTNLTKALNFLEISKRLLANGHEMLNLFIFIGIIFKIIRKKRLQYFFQHC